jgi:aminoglycoside phosphotransferase (APT) family kinase protein
MSRERAFYWKCDCDLSHEEKRRSYFADKYDGRTIAAARAAAEAFAGSDAIDFAHLAVDGNHFAYRFRHDGKDYFLRTDNGLGDDDYMLAESAVLGRLNSHDLPVPNVYRTDVGREQHPFRYQILDFFESPPLLRHFRDGTLDLDAIAVQSGCFLAELHAHRFPGFGFIDTRVLGATGEIRGLDTSWADYFHKCLDRHLGYLRDHALLSARDLERVEARLARHEACLELSGGVLLHRDFALWNILGGRDRIETVIDWDDVVIGDPADDIAIVNCFHEPAYMERLLSAYGETHAVDEPFMRRVSLYTLRNMLWKIKIRHEMGYFDKDDSFFLSRNSRGITLREYSMLKVEQCLEELAA